MSTKEILVSKTHKKCMYCLKKSSLKMNCKFCDSSLCVRCIQPEVHRCEKLNEMKTDLSKKLEHKLLMEKCVRSKIESI